MELLPKKGLVLNIQDEYFNLKDNVNLEDSNEKRRIIRKIRDSVYFLLKNMLEDYIETITGLFKPKDYEILEEFKFLCCSSALNYMFETYFYKISLKRYLEEVLRNIVCDLEKNSRDGYKLVLRLNENNINNKDFNEENEELIRSFLPKIVKEGLRERVRYIRETIIDYVKRILKRIKETKGLNNLETNKYIEDIERFCGVVNKSNNNYNDLNNSSFNSNNNMNNNFGFNENINKNIRKINSNTNINSINNNYKNFANKSFLFDNYNMISYNNNMSNSFVNNNNFNNMNNFFNNNNYNFNNMFSSFLNEFNRKNMNNNFNKICNYNNSSFNNNNMSNNNFNNMRNSYTYGFNNMKNNSFNMNNNNFNNMHNSFSFMSNNNFNNMMNNFNFMNNSFNYNHIIFLNLINNLT